MPDKGKKKLYPILEHMSTEDLEKLLAQDFVASGGSEPDVDYIMAIMEVIQKREAASKPVDLDAAWQDFRDNYQGQASSFETGALWEPDSSHRNQIENKSDSGGKPGKFRYFFVFAAAIIILCGAASAFGFNVFQAMAEWTSETFGFVSPNAKEKNQEKQPVSQDDPYQELRMAVAAETDTPMVPTWAPEGTVLVDDVSAVDRLKSIRIQGTYQTDQGEYTVRIVIYDDVPDDYTATYEKDDRPVRMYEAGGIVHYVMSNNQNLGVAWTNGNLEGSIQGSLTEEELEKMVDSIYKE